MIAFEIEHLDLVKILIEAGANVNQSNEVGTCTRTMHCLGSSCAILNDQGIIYFLKIA